MPSAADFWSSLGQKRRVNAPDPASEKPPGPTPAVAGAPRKAGSTMVFKPTRDPATKGSAWTSAPFTPASTASPVTPSTSTSWADSMEEDEAEGFSVPWSAGKKCQKCNDLADTILQQTKRIQVAETTVSQQEKHIDELEGLVKDKTVRIEQLQSLIQEKEDRLAELVDRTTVQEERIAHLIAQADDEARRVVHLEDELQGRLKLISELELQATEKVTMPSLDTRTEARAPAHENNFAENDPKYDSVPTTPEVVESLQDTVHGASETTPGGSVNTGPASPLENDDEFPALGSPTRARKVTQIFVTPDNIKKVDPPPPAPKMTLGINTANYGKKANTTLVTSVRSAPRHAPNGPATIDPSKDIRRMSKAEREPFGQGPTVHIVLGNEIVAALPKYVFMQCSTKAFQYFSENPNAQTIKFDAGSMNKAALNRHVEWMQAHTFCSKVFSVTLSQEQTDRHNLEIVRAARVLGLHSMYVAHFTKQYCQKIREGPSPELVALIEELSYSDTDTIFDCLANNLAMHHAKAHPENLGNWDKQLTHLPRLAAKMQEIEARKHFARDKAAGKGKQSLPPSKAAGEVTAMTVTAERDSEANWRAAGPSWM